MAINLKKQLSKKWYKSKLFIIGSSVASVGIVSTAIVAPTVLSSNQSGSVVNPPSSEGENQEINNKLNRLNNETNLKEKQGIIKAYLNYKNKNGKTPIDILIGNLQLNTSNNTNLAKFIFHLFPNLQNILTDPLSNEFFEGKNLNLLSNSSSNKTYLENALLSFPSKIQNGTFIQTINFNSNNLNITCTGINWDLSQDIKFVLENKSFFVNLYNETNTNIMNIFVNYTDSSFSYNSGDDKKFDHITLFNYGFDSFNAWFQNNILEKIIL